MPSKRFKKALELVDKKKSYPLKSAVEVLTKFPKAKFNETVDLACCQLPLTRREPSQVLRRNLTQALRINFLYDCTSKKALLT